MHSAKENQAKLREWLEERPFDPDRAWRWVAIGYFRGVWFAALECVRREQ